MSNSQLPAHLLVFIITCTQGGQDGRLLDTRDAWQACTCGQLHPLKASTTARIAGESGAPAA